MVAEKDDNTMALPSFGLPYGQRTNTNPRLHATQ